MTRTIRNLHGMVFGRLTVLDQPYRRVNGKTLWPCRCICGVERLFYTQNLVKGLSTSCGCYAREQTVKALTTHGGARVGKEHPLYTIWTGMIDRCRRPANEGYKNYGGRGITVCPRWQGTGGFPNFVADMGLRPTPDHSIDRRDNDGNYEPRNCRWATKKEQSNNSRERVDAVKLTVGGERISVPAASKKYGVKEFTIYDRLRRGLSGDEAVAQVRRRA